ncbi:MAG: hemerythrin family protein [Anaerolineales bacterium]|nr:hemerythrin family protein [Anaerolineales bacterium]
MGTWNPKTMSVGVKEIDTQHEQLFEQFDKFSAALGTSMAREAAGEILDYLKFYVQWHFGREEDCAFRHQCPIADTNKKAHATFIKNFGKFYDEWQTGNMTDKLAQKTHDGLVQWFVNHVMRIDMTIGEQVNAK